MKRSISISFFGFIVLIAGAIFTLGCYLSSEGASNNRELAIHIFGIVQGIALMISGIGILRLKRWAVYLAIALAIVSIGKAIWTTNNCLSSSPAEYEIYCIRYHLPHIIFNAIIIFFFTRSKVKEQFTRSQE